MLAALLGLSAERLICIEEVSELCPLVHPLDTGKPPGAYTVCNAGAVSSFDLQRR